MVNLKQTALSISIALVMMLFVYYGIETFYPSNNISDKCARPELAYPAKGVPVNQNCTGTNYALEQSCYSQQGTPVYNYTSGCPVYVECSFCYRDLQLQNETHDRNVFIVASIIGVVAILLATLKLTHESVSSGIMGGGVLSVLYGTIRYWSYAQNLIKFLSLGLVLAILIWIGYKKLSDKKRKN